MNRIRLYRALRQITGPVLAYRLALLKDVKVSGAALAYRLTFGSARHA